MILLGERSAFESLGFLLRHSVFLRKLISLLAFRRIPLLKAVFSSRKRLWYMSALSWMYFGHLYVTYCFNGG